MYSVKHDLRQLKNKKSLLYQDVKLIQQLERLAKKKDKTAKQEQLLKQLNLF